MNGRDVHAAWRDGMLAQRRTVEPARMSWETLTDQDRALDEGIAARLNDSRLARGARVVVEECDYEYGTAQAAPSTVALDELKDAVDALNESAS